MWKASVGAKPLPLPKSDDDDWDTDPNFVNNLSEKESRWGAKTIEGSGHQDSVRLDQLRDQVLKSDAIVKESLTILPKPSAGYGGKFGVQTDRVDKCAEKYDYKGKVEPHASQKDYSKGFGGAFGVDKDRQDKSALGWTDKEALFKHESQKDYAVGFGGKHGVQSDRIDKSAVGWDHHEKLHQHESQTDYKQGFGGKYGVQQDRKDKCAAGWEEHNKLYQHESQTDYKKGFGGQYGVQSDRKDKSAVGWDDHEELQQHESQSAYKKGELGAQSRNASDWKERQSLEKHDSQKAAPIPTEKGRASNLRSKFEQLAMQDQDAKVREERERRKREDEELRKKQVEVERIRQQKIDTEWAQQNKNETDVVGITEARNSQLNSPAKTRPSIGIRLPYSNAGVSDDAPPKPVRTSEYVLENSHQQTPLAPATQSPTLQPDNSTQPKTSAADEQTVPINVESESKIIAPAISNTPTGQTSILASSMLRRRNSSTSADEANDDDDDEWGDKEDKAFEEKKQFVLQSPPLARNLADDKKQQESLSKPPTVNTSSHVEPTEVGQPVQQYKIPLAEEIAPAQSPPNMCPNAGNTLTATALFDYEKQDDDEISFDVNDIITDIEQIDVGWWRGMCKGRFGLFPANYVHLNQ